MRNNGGLTCVLLVVLLIPAAARAGQSIRWQPTLDSAKRLADRTNRLVLVHFWAEWCGACRKMERDIIRRPEVAAAVEANFVPVRINVEHFPTTARQYGVTALPAEIVITPQGHVIEKYQGMPTAQEYVARLTRLAAARQRHTAGRYANYPNRAGQPSAAPAVPRQQSQPRVAGNAPPAGTPNPPASPPAQAVPRARLIAPSMPADSHSGNPPLGLDGYCPVQLCDNMQEGKRQWTIGDRRWGAIHRGRTYLFAGPRQQRRFLDAPDRYAPALSGNDVVLAADGGQTVPGRREHGGFFEGRIYLFANEDSLRKFDTNPQHYAAATLRATGAGTPPNRQLH